MTPVKIRKKGVKKRGENGYKKERKKSKNRQMMQKKIKLQTLQNLQRVLSPLRTNCCSFKKRFYHINDLKLENQFIISKKNYTLFCKNFEGLSLSNNYNNIMNIEKKEHGENYVSKHNEHVHFFSSDVNTYVSFNMCKENEHNENYKDKTSKGVDRNNEDWVERTGKEELDVKERESENIINLKKEKRKKVKKKKLIIGGNRDEELTNKPNVKKGEEVKMSENSGSGNSSGNGCGSDSAIYDRRKKRKGSEKKIKKVDGKKKADREENKKDNYSNTGDFKNDIMTTNE
ncbi:hypothetical protein PMALA_064540, partial [Plasmodium malariae]